MSDAEIARFGNEWEIDDALYDAGRSFEMVTIHRNFLHGLILNPGIYYARIAPLLRAILKRRIIEASHAHHRGVHVQLVTSVRYTSLGDKSDHIYHTFDTPPLQVVSVLDVNRTIAQLWADIADKFNEIQLESSGWIVNLIDHTQIDTWFIAGVAHIQGHYNTRHSERKRREAAEAQEEDDEMEHKYDMGGSYIPTPKHIQSKHCTINPQNKDQKCFMYAMELAVKHSTNTLPKNAHRIEHIVNSPLTFDYSQCTWPFHHNQLDKFIAHNHRYRFELRVYFYPKRDEPIQILRNIVETEPDFHIHLLWIETETVNTLDAHWVLITNLNAFLKAPNTTHSFFYCPVCLNPFRTREKLDLHQQEFLCGKQTGKTLVALSYPEPAAAYRSFEDIIKSTFAHFIIYADTEAILIPVTKPLPESAEFHSAHLTHHHVPCSAQFYTVCSFNSKLNHSWLYHTTKEPLFDPASCRFTSDVGDLFLAALEAETERIMNLLLQSPRHLPRGSTNQMKEYEAATLCCLCHLPFDPRVHLRKWGRQYNPTVFPCATEKVKHYNPFLPKKNIIGAAHARCNWEALTYCFKKDFSEFPKVYGNIVNKIDDKFSVTVGMHNWSGYDQSIILNSMTHRTVAGIPTCIGGTGEKFKMVNFNHLQFVDTMAFLKSSLDDLMSRLPAEDFFLLEVEVKKLCEARQIAYDSSMLSLLTKKGEYPYEWFDCIAKFQETALPPIEAFYSTLKSRPLSEEQYIHAQKVWSTFHCITMQDYAEIYLLVDVMGLTCVFESFRKLTQKAFHLDPAHYFSLPQLTWDAGFVKATLNEFTLEYIHSVPTIRPFEIELFNNTEEHTDMFLFSSQMLRGGNAMIGSQREWKKPEEVAGDPSTIEDAAYLDMNSLYPSAMSERLPVGEFEWETDFESINASPHTFICDTDWFNVDRACYVECDLVVPRELHSYFSQFPLAPENTTVPHEWLSDFSLNLLEHTGRKHNSKIKKLVCTLYDKPHYRTHIALLKLYVELGCKVTHIHRLLWFKQKKWIHPFISYCVEQRSKATTKFEENFWKIMMNAFYGKTLQNQKNYVDHTFVFDQVGLLKALNSASYKSVRRLNQNCYIITHHKGQAHITSPIIVGNAVLEISKVFMYSFWYKTLGPLFGWKNLTLLMTDTDSLLFVMRGKKMYDMINENEQFKAMFDFSELPESHPLYDAKNRKLLRFFKDECKGHPLIKFCGLAAKMYAYICFYLDTLKETTKITAKGISEAVRKQHLTYDCYMKALGDAQHLPPAPPKYATIRIGSKNNQLFSMRIMKDGLFAGDTKRYLVDYRTSHPFGFNPL